LTMHQLSEPLAKRTGRRVMSLITMSLRIAYCHPLAFSALGDTLMAMTAEMGAGGMSWMAAIVELIRVIA